MPLIELNLTDEACETFAKYHCKDDDGQTAADFVKAKLLSVMQNSVLEQRKQEALIAVDEAATPNIEG